jgi:hypothetical protein
MRKAFSLLALIVMGAANTGCSTVMEAERPAATNLDKFAVGEKRVDIIAQVGPPLSTIDDAGKSCDVYKVHTKGTNAAGKAGIIFTEAAADFFTLGIAEAVLTPAEAASKAGLHTVMFCYDSDQRLASMRDAGAERNIGALPSSAGADPETLKDHGAVVPATVDGAPPASGTAHSSQPSGGRSEAANPS